MNNSTQWLSICDKIYKLNVNRLVPPQPNKRFYDKFYKLHYI